MTDMEINFQAAERLLNTPPYPFAELARLKREAVAAGVELIDFGIGDPDLPTPAHIVEAAQKAAADPATHQYDETGKGLPEFRQAIVNWYEKRFGVSLDPDKEVLRLIGSKEGLAHLPLAFLNPGDIALVPDPAYPVYKIASMFAGAQPYPLPLTADNAFLPDLQAIPSQVLAKARLMFLCYPNMPTAAVAEKDFYSRLVEFAHRHRMLICLDMAYSEVCFDGYKSQSLLQVEGAKEVAVEIHSLSKTFNMTGWRLGFAVGNPQVIDILEKFKSYMDSGAFLAIQRAAAAGLNGSMESVKRSMDIYQRRRDLLIEGLNSLGWKLQKPRATFYVWAPIPPGYTSEKFAGTLLTKAGILVTPGKAYGQEGEGYVRFALTVQGGRAEEKIQEAVKAMREKVELRWK
jgi:LL-diaminopimelate aminotransferase